jgi:periplasmic divalent cation tolerance protein
MTDSLDAESFARIVLTTAANPDEAERIGRTLVEERLAACATVVPSVRSIYRWEGKIEESSETLLLIKTGAGQIPALEKRLHELHSYQTPEFLVIEPKAGSAAYLEWMRMNLGAR